MATKAKSISAADLNKLTQKAVKAATANVPGKFIGKGPTIGYVLQKELSASTQLNLATDISKSVAASAKTAGITGLLPKPVVVLRPGITTVGFLASELNVEIT